jgi:hypothetical protein
MQLINKGTMHINYKKYTAHQLSKNTMQLYNNSCNIHKYGKV